MLIAIGAVILLIAAVLWLWLGVFLCFIGGIAQVVNSVTPVVDGNGIALGIARIVILFPFISISAKLMALMGFAIMKEE